MIGDIKLSRIFCIVGKSGSGKDTLYNKIINENKQRLVPVIPYTTRPRRTDEKNGVNYHFVSEQQLQKYKAANQIVELRQYNTIKGIWSYFTLKFELEEGKDYILITTLEGVRGILEHYSSDIVHIVCLTLDDKERLLRCINREANQTEPNYLEVCRRYIADHEDFSEEILKHFKNVHYIDSTLSIEECLKQWWILYENLVSYSDN